MSNNTPGRLTTDEAEHDEPYQNIKIKAGEHRTVATVWIDDAPLHDFNAEQRANARRLVACWNACEGVDTQTLEQHPAPFSALRAERDELLAALREIEKLPGVSSANLYARRAIAKATGEH